MKAAVQKAYDGSIEIEQVGEHVFTEPGDIIDVEASGICRSDWHGWKEYDPDIQFKLRKFLQPDINHRSYCNRKLSCNIYWTTFFI